MATNILTVAEVADKLGVSSRRVLALIKANRLPARRIGVQYLIQPKDLAKVRHRKPGRPRKDGR